MALDLGELNIRLQLENDHFRAGLAATKRDLETIPPAARREMVKVGRVMDEEGRKSGSLLAQGVRSGFMRNSPLIVAGIGAALAAGAPVMIAAAGTLFAGIGAIAAAQSLEVRAAWTELGHDIRDGAVEDAAVLVPVYTEMAAEIGAAFQRMRPQLREAFADSAPLIDSFTDGIIALGENAMPGLVRALSSARPVFDGLEHFLAATGTGLADFFDAISGHAPAAGSVFASLGDIMGDLLPILGELIGQGAELAADVLPAVAAATGLTLDVLQALGPLLPSIAAGFLAFKAAQAASGYLSTFSTSLATAGTNMGKFGWQGELAGAGVQKASGAVAAMGKALPVAAVALGVVAAVMARVDQQSSDWAEGLAEGGRAAEAARAQMSDFGAAMEATNSGFEGFIVNLIGGTAPFATTAMALDEAETKAGELEAAERELAAAERGRERQSVHLAYAIQGVTSAMVEQAAQALAAIDSGFAYQHSLNGLEDAQAHLAEAQAHLNDSNEDTRTTTEDVERAQLALAEQNKNVALSYAQQQADLSGLAKDSDAYKRLVQEEMLRELHRLHDAAGPEMKAAIAAQIAALEASGVTLTGTATAAANTAEQMRNLGLKVTEIPGNKTIFIDAPTDEQKRQLADLGLRVMTLPNGKIFVTADTSPAEGTIEAFMNRRRSIQIAVSANPLAAGVGGHTARAEGGPVWPGHTFLVGERGPELVQFAGRGTVIPAEQTQRMLAQPRQVGSATAPATADVGARYIDQSTTNVYAQTDPRRVAREIDERRRDRQYLAGVR